MFSELPKLFDRNFAMAFLLPFIAFFWLAIEVLSLFGLSENLIAFVQVDLVVRTAIVFLVSWLGGIILLVTNNGLYRFLEGYEFWNPLKYFKAVEKGRFDNLTGKIADLDEKYRRAIEGKGEITGEELKERTRLMMEFAKRFPHKAEFLLPTPFGNTIRAFEVYSTEMYGLEAIDGWSRLMAVIPQDYRDVIDNAKIHVDFWINIGFLSILLLLEYISLSIYFGTIHALWLFFVLLFSSVMASRFARSSAVAWGDYIKAAFDMFRHKMREALQFEPPGDNQTEAKQWTSFSQAIVFRSPDSMPPLRGKDTPYIHFPGVGLIPPGDAIVPAPEPAIPLPKVQVVCPDCGTKIQPAGRFCSNCGRPVG